VLERQHTDGVAAMEFPLYQYILSLGYDAVGFHEGLGKALSLLCSLATIALYHRFVRRLLGRRIGDLAALTLTFSTLFFTYAAKVMPETMALALCMGALTLTIEALFDDVLRPRVPNHFLLAATTILFALAILIKMNMIIAALFIAYLAHRRFGWSFLLRPDFILMAGASLVPFFWWYYWYAPAMENCNALNVFFLGYSMAETVPMLFDGRIDWIKVFCKVLPQDYLGWGLSAAVLYGGWRAVQAGRLSPLPCPVIASLAVTAVYFALILLKSGDKFVEGHSYYLYGSLPFVPMVVAFMLDAGLRNISRRMGIVLVVIVFLALAGRVGHYYKRDPVPDRLIAMRPLIDAVVPPGARIGVNVPVNPMNLYFFRRTGWLLSNGQLTDREYMERLRERGLRYLVLVAPKGVRYEELSAALLPELVWLYPEQELTIMALPPPLAEKARDPVP
jgi:hypothetical protein